MNPSIVVNLGHLRGWCLLYYWSHVMMTSMTAGALDPGEPIVGQIEGLFASNWGLPLDLRQMRNIISQAAEARQPKSSNF